MFSIDMVQLKTNGIAFFSKVQFIVSIVIDKFNLTPFNWLAMT